MKIWFFARLYYPYQKSGGGQIRAKQVASLKEAGFDVTVVMPNYTSKENNINDELVQLSFTKNLKILSVMQRLGIYEDYLDGWLSDAFSYLKTKVKKDDILFATSGGELGMIKLASMLKEETLSKFIINFHDPLDYSKALGMRLNKKFHISREKQELKYLSNSDLIITSSLLNQKSLQKKYPNLKDKIKNNYFGYIKRINLDRYTKKVSDKLRIAYAGNMAHTQKPEILYDVYKKLPYEYQNKVHIYFIGNTNSYKPLNNIDDKNITFISYLEHEEFLKFMIENIDVGFLSLVSDYFGLCVPSKLYEYINLALPMLGALPDGDAKDMINQKGYGIASKYDDITTLTNTIIEWIEDKNKLDKIYINILKDKEKYSMDEQFKEVEMMIRGLI
jgi:glycosyltransferase involved in cell wall biosynthesis